MTKKTIGVRSERRKLMEAKGRKDIVRAAEALILRRGFSRLTMDALAREAQFSKATLYRYFRSKTQVVAAIFINYFDRMIDRLTRIREGRADHSTKLREIIRVVLEMHEETRNLSQSLLIDEVFMKKAGVLLTGHDRVPAPSEDRRALKHIHDKVREVGALLSAFLAEGVKAGEFQTTDPDLTVLWLTAAMDGFCHRQNWLPVKINIERAAEFTHQFIMHGLAPRSGSRKGEMR